VRISLLLRRTSKRREKRRRGHPAPARYPCREQMVVRVLTVPRFSAPVDQDYFRFTARDPVRTTPPGGRQTGLSRHNLRVQTPGTVDGASAGRARLRCRLPRTNAQDARFQSLVVPGQRTGDDRTGGLPAPAQRRTAFEDVAPRAICVRCRHVHVVDDRLSRHVCIVAS
jgi:hypothetical protein